MWCTCSNFTRDTTFGGLPNISVWTKWIFSDIFLLFYLFIYLFCRFYELRDRQQSQFSVGFIKNQTPTLIVWIANSSYSKITNAVIVMLRIGQSSLWNYISWLALSLSNHGRVYLSAWVCVCVCVWVPLCVCVCVWVPLRVCVCVWVPLLNWTGVQSNGTTCSTNFDVAQQFYLLTDILHLSACSETQWAKVLTNGVLPSNFSNNTFNMNANICNGTGFMHVVCRKLCLAPCECRDVQLAPF